MNFSDFKAKDAYKAVFSHSQLLHAYLVCGEDGEDKAAFTDTLAAAMICENSQAVPCGVCRSCKKSLRKAHPDIITITPQSGKRIIPVETIRQVRNEAIVLPNEADRKVFIIKHADYMNTAAQNAFLKILEEPPSYARFILSAENSAALLTTVRSRCAELRISSEHVRSENESSELASLFVDSVIKGGLSLAEFTYSLEKLDRDKMQDFVTSSKEETIYRLRTGRLPSHLAGKLISVLDKCEKHINSNVNTGHVSGMICAELV